MLLHRPDASVALTQQITLGGFRLLPHIGDTEQQIFKGDSSILAGSQGALGAIRPGEREYSTG